jgi:hypothetical protein
MGDNATAAAAAAAYERGVAATYSFLWNSTYSYFRAYTSADAVMADSLYGALWADHVGLGWVVNASDLAAHLAVEQARNANPYGLTVMVGRYPLNPTVDDVIWEGGAADWSYLQIRLGMDPDAALAPLFAEVFNYRDRLHDLWDIAGIYTTGDWGASNITQNGQPYGGCATPNTRMHPRCWCDGTSLRLTQAP